MHRLGFKIPEHLCKTGDLGGRTGVSGGSGAPSSRSTISASLLPALHHQPVFGCPPASRTLELASAA